MSTFHEQLARDTYEQEMRDPEILSGFHAFLDRIRTGVLDQIMPAIGINAGTQNDYAQLFAAWRIYAEISTGFITASAIHVGSTPVRDSRREENQARLDAGLPEPYCAEVDMHQHMAECDGVLRWTAPITLTDCLTGQRRSAHVSQAPLEIGDTKPSRTWMHLITPGYESVARWPYDEDIIHLYARRSTELLAGAIERGSIPVKT